MHLFYFSVIMAVICIEGEKIMRKKLFNTLFLLVVFGLTLYTVFRGEDLRAVIDAIMSVNHIYLIPAAVCVVFFVLCESTVIHYMLSTLNIKVKRKNCILYSGVGFFFSAITPSASGGQPMQIYYMNKDDIPVPVSTLVLMIVTITYKAVLIITAIGILIFHPGFIYNNIEPVLMFFYFGLFLSVSFCLALLIVVFHPVLARKIVVSMERFLVKIHILRDKPERLKALYDSMQQYYSAAGYLRTHKLVILKVQIITFIQRFAIFSVTWFVFKAFGLKGIPFYEIVLLQSVISISADMLPFPGGMGISENLFLIIFTKIFKESLLLPGMILSRGIAFYIQLIFCGILTFIAHFFWSEDKKA